MQKLIICLLITDYVLFMVVLSLPTWFEVILFMRVLGCSEQRPFWTLL
jgi:hypothetical protein